MSEWSKFDKITNSNGVWLTDSHGNTMIDAVASMWCNVWGHSNPRLLKAMTQQSKRLQHTSLFNITHEPAEKLANSLVKLSPGMHKVFYSDNGSSAMEIAIKMSLQYWINIGDKEKTEIATLQNGYHGDTFGAMSVGYVPEFFGNFKKQLFSTRQFPVPSIYRIPKSLSVEDYQSYCLEKIEKRFAKNTVAAFVMESGAQVAGGVIIYLPAFQKNIHKLCKKYDVLFVLDEIATGFGRMGSMVQYVEQQSTPDIVAYGKMLTGGYLTMAATLANKKVYESFLGKYDDFKHLFHGHTYTGNPIAAAVANENLLMYKQNRLIEEIQKTSKIFEQFYDELYKIDVVGDIRHKGMLMGIELVCDKNKKTPIRSQDLSINRVFYKEGKKHGIYLRTLGNIVMLVPPLAITQDELYLLLQRTVQTIKSASSKIDVGI